MTRFAAALLGLALLAAPLAAGAQSADKIYRIGLLRADGPVATWRASYRAFLEGLRELGYAEGSNLAFEVRSAEGKYERLPALAAQLVERPIDVFFASGDEKILALKQATSTIPIAMTACDALEVGFISSLAQPGGNLTRVTCISGDLAVKRLELLKQAVPKMSRLAVLCHPGDPGYVDGRTLSLEYRTAEGQVDRLPALAADLVRSKVNVIFTTWGTAAALAAKRATATIPVVMGAAGDPVRAGIVPSLAKPGGNVTGLSSLALELETKRLELLKQVVPNVSRVGVFWDPENPYSALAIKQEEMVANAVGVHLHPVRLRGAPDLENAFAALKRDRVEALSVHGYVATLQHRAAIVAFTTANRMAAIYPLREYVTEGGLVSYGANLAEISRRAAHYVDRILKGAKPADLPVEQPTKFELVINLKTAKTLGLTIRQSVLLRADEVIQ